MLLRPVDSDRAAARENHDERLFGGGERPEKLFLKTRQAEAEAIAAEEPRIAAVGFFAFELGG